MSLPTMTAKICSDHAFFFGNVKKKKRLWSGHKAWKIRNYHKETQRRNDCCVDQSRSPEYLEWSKMQLNFCTPRGTFDLVTTSYAGGNQ